jgi:hypothetical protein
LEKAEQITNIVRLGRELMSLLLEIDRYLRRTGIAETTFGRRAVNDPRLVGDLRRGRCPGPALSARVQAIIRPKP